MGVVTPPVKVGVVPRDAAVGITGTANVVLLPLLMATLLVQLMTPPVTTQPKMPVEKVASVVIPDGKGRLMVVSPVVGPDPMLLTLTGRLLVASTARTGDG